MNRRSFLALPLGLSMGCVFDARLKQDTGVVPDPLDDGWPIATPESVGLDAKALASIHATLLREDRFPGSLALLVAKDGKLVFETYLRTLADRDRIHHVQSVTKSVVAMVVGAARDRGFFPSIDAPLAALLPDRAKGLDATRAGVTLRQLLTMSSGIHFDNTGFDLEMWASGEEDPLGVLLGKPLGAPPGTRFDYTNADPQLVAYALERALGLRMRTFAEQALFAPLDVKEFYWDAGPSDRVTIAGNGLHLRPRDLAKLGQVVVDAGTWRTRAVLSRAWTAEMTSGLVTSDEADSRGTPFRYGYYWWVTEGGAAAWGTGGQFVVTVPAKRLVLTHVAMPNTSGMDGSTLEDFLALVAPLL